MIFRMQKFELHEWGTPRITRDQVTKLAQNVASDFDHILVTCGGLQSLKHRFGGITLNNKVFTVLKFQMLYIWQKFYMHLLS